ncbi:MAG: L-rhamnose isomerase [Limnochordaceae bacterium]|nr:L-rhamnose isomerase [Limnochordaceae bacterium]
MLVEELEADGVQVDVARERLLRQHVETPSWGYADSGTRFKVFHQPGAARTPFEKLEDAAQVMRYTGIARSVAIHIPWDKVDDYAALKRRAEELGIAIGAVNPNLFQDDDYRFGSLAHPDEKVRKKAIAHVLECIDIMRQTGSRDLSLWLADGTDYPGQDDLRARKRRLEESLAEIYRGLDPHMRLLLEYKLFEPAFYSTDVPDWGTAFLHVTRLGPQAYVLVDLGHHAHGVNVEQIVAFLLDERRLGGFHFNARKYADDDLTTGSINPYELFLIYAELAAAEERNGGRLDVASMIDQSHNTKPKVEATIQSVVALQEAYARALLINRKRLEAAQQAQDVVAAEEELLKAFRRDVTPLLVQVRRELGVPEDPLEAFRRSGYAESAARARG